MTQTEFEELLTAVAAALTEEVGTDPELRKPSAFEGRARALLRELAGKHGIEVDPEAHAQVFPDIPVGAFGVEVKVNSTDSWRSVANSVFEGTPAETRTVHKTGYRLSDKIGDFNLTFRRPRCPA
jgi:hypothetical protein